ncbi:MAG: hypothetical protein A3F74_18555 [Betaproteobacteria bacterium RIFCSPLOWO2_12_FULL_62_58]|nr:MAG: hypothetical protein A3F74_18555 [Betaproteobacteria bacterium RIFCSPLOWO2_12_FULL_62_58]
MERYVHSFGASFAVAVLLTAFVFAIKAVFPELEEWSEELFGHAWLYMGVLALVVFVGLGLSPVRLTASSRGLATLVAGAAVIAGVVIAVAAAVAAFG